MNCPIKINKGHEGLICCRQAVMGFRGLFVSLRHPSMAISKFQCKLFMEVLCISPMDFLSRRSGSH